MAAKHVHVKPVVAPIEEKEVELEEVIQEPELNDSDESYSISSDADLSQLEYALESLVDFAKINTAPKDVFAEFDAQAETQSVNKNKFSSKKTFKFDKLPMMKKETHSIKKMGKGQFVYSY